MTATPPGGTSSLPAVRPGGRDPHPRRVTVGLAWDLPAGRASALLRSRADQLVDVVCRGARELRCGAVMTQISEHGWRLRLTAGTTVQAEIGELV